MFVNLTIENFRFLDSGSGFTDRLGILVKGAATAGQD